jgi:transposase
MAGRPARNVALSPEQRKTLQSFVLRPTAPQGQVTRAWIALLAADGMATTAIATRLGVTAAFVSKWRKRFARGSKIELGDSPRSGRPRRIAPEARLELVALACAPARKEDGRATPTLSEIATTAVERGVVDRISRSHLQRILAAGDVRPHRVRMWLHSPDPEFRRKVNDICGLYHRPPPGAAVVCVDEKTGIQALERLHPGREPGIARLRRQEFEYVRHGTQALIAGFDVQTTRVFGTVTDRRTGDDLEHFMDLLAEQYREREVHIVWDNLNTHRAQQSRWIPWNQRHGGRFHFHLTPLHASWVNQVELWFGILHRRVLKNATWKNVASLRAAILDYIADEWNRRPAQPFRWTFQGYPLQTGIAAP